MKYSIIFLITILIMAVCLTTFGIIGSLAVHVSEPVYKDGNLSTFIQYTGEDRNVLIQQKIYQLKYLSSQEIDYLEIPHELKKGTYNCETPMHLNPGKYKQYLYILEDGTPQYRISAFIQTFTVT